MPKVITPAEVATHNTPDTGMYIIIDGGVYDVTSESRVIASNWFLIFETEFVDEHPGG